jgi:chromate transporter
MAGVLVILAGDAFTDVFTVLLGVVALIVLLRTQINSAWLIAGGAAIGIANAAIA